MSDSKLYDFIMIRWFALVDLVEAALRLVLGYKAPNFSMDVMLAEHRWRCKRRGKWPDRAMDAR